MWVDKSSTFRMEEQKGRSLGLSPMLLLESPEATSGLLGEGKVHITPDCPNEKTVLTILHT